VKVKLHAFLTSKLGRREWSASRPGRLRVGERTLNTNWTGGLVSPTAGLDAVAKKKIFFHRSPGKEISQQYTE